MKNTYRILFSVIPPSELVKFRLNVVSSTHKPSLIKKNVTKRQQNSDYLRLYTSLSIM